MTMGADLIHALDLLDLILAVFGAIVFSLLFGRGRTLGGMLTGALVGGSIKPVVFGLILGGLLLGYEQNKINEQTPEEQDKVLDFWLK